MKMKSDKSTTDKFSMFDKGFEDEDHLLMDSFEFLSSGINSLDKILGGSNGGIAIGTVCELFGPTGYGKSTLAGMISFQTVEKGWPVFYYETEGCWTNSRLKMLGIEKEGKHKGLFRWGGMPDSIEYFFEHIINNILNPYIENGLDCPFLIVLDSLAQIPTNRDIEVTAETGYDKDMGYKAKVIGVGIRKISKILSQTRGTLIIVNQLRENTGQNNPYGPRYFTPGGNSVKFAAVQRLEIKPLGSPFDLGGVSYIKIGAETKKNKAYTPYLKTSLMFNVNTGLFDVPMTYFESLKEEKRIVSSGPVWKLNLNPDPSDDSNIIKFARKDWEEIYEQNKKRIYEVTS
jgi:recombination protein RecA